MGTAWEGLSKCKQEWQQWSLVITVQRWSNSCIHIHHRHFEWSSRLNRFKVKLRSEACNFSATSDSDLSFNLQTAKVVQSASADAPLRFRCFCQMLTRRHDMFSFILALILELSFLGLTCRNKSESTARSATHCSSKNSLALVSNALYSFYLFIHFFPQVLTDLSFFEIIILILR